MKINLLLSTFLLVLTSCASDILLVDERQVTEITEVVQEYVTPEVIYPCGIEGGYEEILFKISDDTIISYFRSDDNEYLTVLPIGNYITTDYKKCKFTITEDYQVIETEGN